MTLSPLCLSKKLLENCPQFLGISWLPSSSGISRNQQCTSQAAGVLLPALTCAHFLLTVLDVVVFKLQLLHAGAGNAWNVGKVGGGRFGNRRIAAFHQELAVINNPGTWGEQQHAQAWQTPWSLRSFAIQNTQGLDIE